METKEKQRLVVAANYKILFCELDEQRAEGSECAVLSLFRFSEGRQWQPDGFSWFAARMSLVS